MERVRIDKWLWAARFFKTRGDATEAVAGGHVQVNGARVKPSKDVGAGDRLLIRRGAVEWTVDVLGVAERRGPAKVAAGLYEELPESREAREAQAARAAAREAARRRPRLTPHEAGPPPDRGAAARGG